MLARAVMPGRWRPPARVNGRKPRCSSSVLAAARRRRCSRCPDPRRVLSAEQSRREHSGGAMTAIAKLLAQKQQLIERLQDDDVGPNERADLEAVLAKINTALTLLDGEEASER